MSLFLKIIDFFSQSLNPVLIVVIIATLFFLLFSLFFAVYSIILRLRFYRREKRRKILEAQWKPVVLKVLSGSEKPETLIEGVLKRDQLLFVDYIMRYALRLRGEEQKTVARLAEPFLDRLFHRLIHGDTERRSRAVQTLSVLGFDRNADTIIAALDDPSQLVAIVAIHALASKEHSQYIDVVLERLHRFENWNAGYIASKLAGVGPKIAPALRKKYANTAVSSKVRVILAESLRLLRDYAAADIAAEILSRETDRDLLSASLRLLATRGRIEHLGVIRRHCENEDDIIRAQALRALGKLGDSGDLELLRSGLFSKSPWVVLHAAKGLVLAGGVEYLKQISLTGIPQAEVAREVLREYER